MFLDSIFGPLLTMESHYAIILISFLIALIMTLIYKAFTDQKLIKSMKDEIKSMQKQARELREFPEKALELNKKLGKKNIEMMKHTLRPTLITMVPILLIFWWMKAHFAFVPIMPGDDFSITVELQEGYDVSIDVEVPNEIAVLGREGETFSFKAIEEGEFSVDFFLEEKGYTQPIIVTTNHEYAKELNEIDDDKVKSIRVNYKENKVMKNIPILNQVPWIKGFGWLGTYILFSIIFSMSLRKLLRLH